MEDLQRSICEKFGSTFYGVDMNLKVGIALQTLHLKPIRAIGWTLKMGTMVGTFIVATFQMMSISINLYVVYTLKNIALK